MTLLQSIHRRMGELLTCPQGYRACVCPPGIHDLKSKIVSHHYSVPFAEWHRISLVKTLENRSSLFIHIPIFVQSLLLIHIST